MTPKETLAFYVKDFKNWRQENYTEEQIDVNNCDDVSYPKWEAIEDFFSRLLDTREISQLDKEDKTNLLYLIGRGWDNATFLAELTEKRPISQRGNLKHDDFIALAEHVITLHGAEYDDAKASIAMCFRKLEYLTPKIENILLTLYNDKQEYTKRMALLALAKLGYKNIIDLVEQSWSIEDEWHKISCLSILGEYVKDKALLIKYIGEVINDNRKDLREHALQLRDKNSSS